MDKKYSLYDLVEILAQNPKFLLHVVDETQPEDVRKVYVLYVGENTYPISIREKDGEYVGIVDDYNYNSDKTLEYPIIELNNRKYLEVDFRFISKYIHTTELDGIDVVDIPLAEVVLNELNSGSILIKK